MQFLCNFRDFECKFHPALTTTTILYYYSPLAQLLLTPSRLKTDALLENAVLNEETNVADYFDTGITENGRVS